MSDYNGLGQSQFANSLFAYGLGGEGIQSPYNGFWQILLGPALVGVPPVVYGPDADGWREYYGGNCPQHKLCQFKQGREENEGEPWIGYARDFHPDFNVADLKWRLTGIGKETP